MSRSLEEKTFGDDNHVPAQVDFSGKVVAEPNYQPVNKATHECLRGPCKHFWFLTTRMGDADIGDQIQIKQTPQCNAHFEATGLEEINIYHCSMWWPGVLSFVPLSLQMVLRPRLRKMWEWWLKKIGYDFSWKNWPDDIFQSDTKDLRGNCSPGAPSNVDRRFKQSNQGIEFNT
jgi:hypothetical protein